MIDGCLLWQANGLQPPEVVRSATAAYLEGEDAHSAWIDDKCNRNPQAWEYSQSFSINAPLGRKRPASPSGRSSGFRKSSKRAASLPSVAETDANFLGLQVHGFLGA